ncbi:MAG: multidrug resistance efflux transporter family protein, partial [Tumebacillaceae bacterium]
MMEVVGDRLDTFQRVLGMTIASLPFWLLLSVYGAMTDGEPRGGQVLQTLLVALSSGVIATVMFFYATDLAKHNVAQLAAVEATQAGEVVFTILGEVVVLGGLFPQGWSLLGMVLVVVGMILHSLVSQVGSFLDFIEGKGRKSKLNRESN